jgi:hypothetical protein
MLLQVVLVAIQSSNIKHIWWIFYKHAYIPCQISGATLVNPIKSSQCPKNANFIDYYSLEAIRLNLALLRSHAGDV